MKIYFTIIALVAGQALAELDIDEMISMAEKNKSFSKILTKLRQKNRKTDVDFGSDSYGILKRKLGENDSSSTSNNNNKKQTLWDEFEDHTSRNSKIYKELLKLGLFAGGSYLLTSDGASPDNSIAQKLKEKKMDLNYVVSKKNSIQENLRKLIANLTSRTSDIESLIGVKLNNLNSEAVIALDKIK